MKTHRTIFRSLAAALMIAAATTAQAGCFSEGLRVGDLQKFSKKGVAIKSWEGEMVMEGTKVSSAGGVLRGGNIWKFSVEDAAVAAKIEDAMMTGRPIALKYCQGYMSLGQTDTTYIVIMAAPR